MKTILPLFFSASLLFDFCKQTPVNQIAEIANASVETSVQIDTGQTIASRFRPPAGYQREAVSATSFADYLRNLPLKEAGSLVLLFNGQQKASQHHHAAVIDLDVGKRDLQQCADAIMRLRAEYLFQKGRYEDIQFEFSNGFKAAYSTWRSGHRITVNGNNVKWVPTSRESSTYSSFRKYLDMVFAYAGTYSLAREMHSIDLAEMKIGDVFVQAGSPGHAVIVVDMAVNETTGQKVFMLAQSYMPAQDIHILKNHGNNSLSPWYELDFGEILKTPEWRFSQQDLKQFSSTATTQ